MKKCRSCKKEIDEKARKCPYCHEKQGNWVIRHPILTIIIGIIVLIMTANSSSDQNSSNIDLSTSPSNATQSSENISESKQEQELINESTSQKNAVRTANSYLNIGGFSRAGLIKQLEFEKYSRDDATYAVDKINPDWNEQASIKAKSYNDMSGFSKEGLIKQLEFEGFTIEQATYGANSVGL